MRALLLIYPHRQSGLRDELAGMMALRLLEENARLAARIARSLAA